MVMYAVCNGLDWTAAAHFPTDDSERITFGLHLHGPALLRLYTNLEPS